MLYIALAWPLVESGYKLIIEEPLPSLAVLDRTVCMSGELNMKYFVI